MNAKIENNAPYKLNKKEGYSQLSVKNIITGEYVDTPILLFNDDISMQSRIDKALEELAEASKSVEPIDREAISSALKELESKASLNDEQKSLLNKLVFLQADLHSIENISEIAMHRFDDIFGNNSLYAIIEAMYGRQFMPPVTTTLAIMTFLGSASTMVTSNALSERIQQIKERIK